MQNLRYRILEAIQTDATRPLTFQSVITRGDAEQPHFS